MFNAKAILYTVWGILHASGFKNCYTWESQKWLHTNLYSSSFFPRSLAIYLKKSKKKALQTRRETETNACLYTRNKNCEQSLSCNNNDLQTWLQPIQGLKNSYFLYTIKAWSKLPAPMINTKESNKFNTLIEKNS